MLAALRSQQSHRPVAGRRDLLVIVALACLPLAACGSDDSGPNTVKSQQGTAGNDDTTVTTPESSAPAADAIATVVYQYHDASVAPEYHRSYTVTVTESSATVVVDSYGDLVAQDTQPIDPAMWNATVDATESFAGTASVENDGCAGGTADELTALDAAGATVLHVFIDDCADAGATDVSAAVAGVLPLFDLATMTATS